MMRPIHRQAIELRAIGLSFDEIAVHLGVKTSDAIEFLQFAILQLYLPEEREKLAEEPLHPLFGLGAARKLALEAESRSRARELYVVSH